MAKSKVTKTKGDTFDQKSKVSAGGGAVDCRDHHRNLVRQLDMLCDAGVPCCVDACSRTAVQVWASSQDPDDVRNLCAVCGGVAGVGSTSTSKKVLRAPLEKPCQNHVDAPHTIQAKDDVTRHISDNSSDDSGAESNPDNEESKTNNSLTTQDNASLGQEEQQSFSTPSVDLGLTNSCADSVETPPNASSDGHDVSEKPSPSFQHPTLHSTDVVDSSHSADGPPLLPIKTPNSQINHPLVSIDSYSQSQEKWDIVRQLEPKVKITCRVDGCRRRAVECWASNHAPDDEWNMCAKCVLADFGPEEKDMQQPTQIDDLSSTSAGPKSTTSANDADIVAAKAVLPAINTEHGQILTSPTKAPALECMDVSPDVDVEAEESWDMKKVMSYAELAKEGTIKCSTEVCTLAAASVYCSTLSKQQWYSCLDCQVVDYGGWPEKLEEIPIKGMTDEHKLIMAQKCSRLSSPVFPKFPESPTKAFSATNTLTPPPNGAQQVTPTPGAKKSQPSAQAMAIHSKWQIAATAMGGPEARIVVDKKAAKKLIVDLLYDAFCPMNITQIHTALKAVVPSPVLKQCLDDMALDKEDNTNLFVDSDDDEPKAIKKKAKLNSNDEFAGALGFKPGRNANTSLYFIDHTKQKNNGNGLEFDVRDKLYTEKSQAAQEHSKLENELSQMEVDTKRLNSEPTNEEATTKLETDELAMLDLRVKVAEARKLKVNEKHKKQTKLRIDGMTTQWRKRRRICMDFLINMEENTDGSISMKKCLAGDGQIDIESDEKVIKDTIAFAENKRARKKFKSACKKSNTTQTMSSCITVADENFVGVLIDSQGNVSRVYLERMQNN